MLVPFNAAALILSRHKFGLNHIVAVIEAKKASLVVIVHNVDPIELVVLPCATRWVSLTSSCVLAAVTLLPFVLLVYPHPCTLAHLTCHALTLFPHSVVVPLTSLHLPLASSCLLLAPSHFSTFIPCPGTPIHRALMHLSRALAHLPCHAFTLFLSSVVPLASSAIMLLSSRTLHSSPSNALVLVSY
ncbi:hypothetical protein B0H11DRAFT_2227800 [Mycena galericulata]|nr:hypothetical protein B0H11DRAFT_2227800 [Mycena galericulata]